MTTDYFPLGNSFNEAFRSAIEKYRAQPSELVLDLCAGTGDFLRIFLSCQMHETRNHCVEIDSEICKVLKDNVCGAARIWHIDFFAPEVDELLAHADWILVNPPFRAYRNCTSEQKAQVRKVGFMPDLGASIIYRTLRLARNGATCLIVGKSIYFHGSGFTRLRNLISDQFSILEYIPDIGEIVEGSNKAKCALIIIKKCECQRNFSSSQDEEELSFGDFADVVAGPSTGDDSRFIGRGTFKLVRVPRGASFLNGSAESSFSPILWAPEDFRYRRSMDKQDRLGIVYGLVRNGFHTAVKPTWARFLSGTPGIFPHHGDRGLFALGLLSLGSFQEIIRSRRHGLSLNPGDIRRIVIHHEWISERGKIEELGEQVFHHIKSIEGKIRVDRFCSKLYRELSCKLER